MGQSLILVFAVEGDDRVADDVRQHNIAARSLDLVDHRTPFRMAEFEILIRNPLAAVLLDQDLADLCHFARVDVVRADDEEFLLAQGLDDPGNEIRKLLVRNCAGVDHVLGTLEAFVVGGVEIQVVALLEHRKHRLAAGRCIRAEHRRHFILDHQLGSFFVIGFRIRRAVFDNGVDLHALGAAGRIDLADRHQGGVVQ